jgi:hypothetical protein
MNFYEALNLSPKATVEEIEQAYRQLARLVHPDFHPDQANASEDRMKVLNQVRDTLTDSERRAKYDAELIKSSAGWKTGALQAIQLNLRWNLAWSDKPWAFVIVTGIVLGLILGCSLWLHRRPSASSSPLSINQPASSLPSQFSTSDPKISAVTAPLVKPAVAPSKLPPQVVQHGSSLNEIFQMMGEPDRVEEDSSHGLKILYYGKLCLILRNGQLVQGRTLP